MRTTSRYVLAAALVLLESSSCGGEVADPEPWLSVAVPRLVSPLAGEPTTARSVVLRWVLPPEATGARVELCSDRECQGVLRRLDASGTSTSVSLDGLRGAVFWHVRVGEHVSPTRSFVVGTTGTGLVLGSDLNGDGYPDVLTSLGYALGGPNGLSPLRPYCSNARFRPPPPYAQVQALGDIDDDGFADVRLTEPQDTTYSTTVHVCHGAPDGMRAEPSNEERWGGKYCRLYPGTTTCISSTGTPLSVLGDINGDGRADIDANAFASPPVGVRRSPLGEAIGDVDGDGLGDALVYFFDDPSRLPRKWVCRGTPNGLVQVEPLPVDAIPVGDVNGDGRADLLCYGPECQSKAPLVFFFGGEGAHLTRVEATLGGAHPYRDGLPFRNPSHLRPAGDLDGDGLADVVGIAKAKYDAYVAFLGGPPGLRWAPDLVLRELRAGSFRLLGDIDGDGWPDVLESSERSKVHFGPLGSGRTQEL